MDWGVRRILLRPTPAGSSSSSGGRNISRISEAALSTAFAETDSSDVAGLRVGVAFVYLFLAFYSVGNDAVGVAIYSELFPNYVGTPTYHSKRETSGGVAATFW